MSTDPNKLFDNIVYIKGIYEKIFGNKLLKDLINDPEFERSKRILNEVYGYKNIDTIFGNQILKGEFKNISKIIFRVYEKANEK